MFMDQRKAPCPCESGKKFEECCDPFISGQKLPSTALALMRSRYVATVIEATDYLLATWHPKTRPASLGLDVNQRWLGLKIEAVESGEPSQDKGSVDFVARYKIAGKAFRLRELSRFQRVGKRWYYVDGDILAQARR